MCKSWVKQLALFSLLTFILSPQLSFAQPTTIISTAISPNTDLTNYNVFISFFVYTNNNGQGIGVEGLLSVADDYGIVPVQVVMDTSLIKIYALQVIVLPDVLSKTYTLTGTNYTYGTNFSETFTVGQAQFATVPPANQSVFFGSSVSFSISAISLKSRVRTDVR